MSGYWVWTIIVMLSPLFLLIEATIFDMTTAEVVRIGKIGFPFNVVNIAILAGGDLDRDLAECESEFQEALQVLAEAS